MADLIDTILLLTVFWPIDVVTGAGFWACEDYSFGLAKPGASIGRNSLYEVHSLVYMVL